MRKLFKKAVCITSAITIGISGTWMMQKTAKAEETTVQEETTVTNTIAEQETTTAQSEKETTTKEPETTVKREETTTTPKPEEEVTTPAIPSKLSITSLSNSIYQLKWTGKADGFIIKLYDYRGKQVRRLKTSKNYYNLHLTADCNYSVAVVAYNKKSNGKILYSRPSVKKAFGIVKKLVAPTIVSTYKQSDGKKFSLRWKATDRATYYVQRYNTQKKSWITLKVTKSNRATVSTKANAAYKFRVVAKKYVNRKLTKVAGAGKWYGTYTFAPVKIIKDYFEGDTSLTYHWKVKKGVIRYNVYLRTDKNGSWKKIDVLKINPKTGNRIGRIGSYNYHSTDMFKGGHTYYLRIAPVQTVRGKAYLGKMSNTLTLKLPYTEDDRRQDYIDKEIDRIIKAAKITSKMSETEKAVRALTSMSCYMKNGYDWKTYNQMMNGTYKPETKYYDCYVALKNKTGLCEDYMKIVFDILSRFNINESLACGTKNGGMHEWIMAELDGKFYHIDMTGASNAFAWESREILGSKAPGFSYTFLPKLNSGYAETLWPKTNHDYSIRVINSKEDGMLIRFFKGTNKKPYKTIKSTYLNCKF